jgi:hypothetical protein
MAMAPKRRRTSRKTARPADLSVKKTKATGVKGGDEVLVAFQPGDVRSPYVVGTLWNGGDPPPTTSSSGSPRTTLKKA